MKHSMLGMLLTATVVVCGPARLIAATGTTVSATSKVSAEQPVAPSVSGALVLATPTNRLPISLAIFLRVPPPGFLSPESDAGKAVAKAQDLFRQGQTNSAVDVLTKAVKDSAGENECAIVARKLITLLLYSDRVADAQTAYIASATNEQAAVFNVGLVNGYLTGEKERGGKESPGAAAEWAARLESLPLRGPAADYNLGYHLSALAASGKIDEAIRRVPEVVARTNEVMNAVVLGDVADGMIGESEFQQAERFLRAVEEATAGRTAYTGMVTNLRQTLEGARAKSASRAPPGQ